MAHEIETFISTKQEWHHHLTQHPTVTEPMTAEQALVLGGLDWVVEKRPTFYMSKDGQYLRQPDSFAVVRVTDDKSFGTVSKDYKTFQSKQLLDTMAQLAEDTGVFRFQTAGAIYGGKTVFALGAFVKTYSVLKGDEWHQFLFGTLNHSGEESVRFFPTSTRVVCANTHGEALRGADERKMFRIPHIGDFDVKIEEAREALGLVTKRIDETMDGMRQLARIVMNQQAADRFINALIPLPDPAKAKNGLEEQQIIVARERLEAKQGVIVQLHEAGVSARAFPAQRGTAYGWFNAVTEYTTHQAGHGSDKSLGGHLKALTTGEASKLNGHALKLLRAEAVAA